MRLVDATRSKNMSAVRSANTKPELYVRRRLHKAGYRFRLHRRDLPGRADLVLPRFRIAVLVHGCFWHGHSCEKGRTRPKTNAEFWEAKLDSNKRRDLANFAALMAAGWKPRILWECTLEQDCASLIADLRAT
mgnify:CR=1 FL=1